MSERNYWWVGSTGMAIRYRELTSLIASLEDDGFTVTHDRNANYVATRDDEVRTFDYAGTSVPRSALI